MAKRKRPHLVLSRHQAWQVATAAYANAKSLRSASALLAGSSLHGSAVALAVLGIEEAAKSFHAYLFALTGTAKSDMWDVLFSKHRPKQASGLTAEILAQMNPRLERLAEKKRELFDQRFPNATDEERVARLMPWLLRYTERFCRRNSRVLERAVTAATERWRRVVDGGELDKLKMDGLYVGFDAESGSVSDPRNLPPSAVAGPLQALDLELERLEFLDRATSDYSTHTPSEIALAGQEAQQFFISMLSDLGLPPFQMTPPETGAAAQEQQSEVAD
jgi:AbiV family abortive infection protein